MVGDIKDLLRSKNWKLIVESGDTKTGRVGFIYHKDIPRQGAAELRLRNLYGSIYEAAQVTKGSISTTTTGVIPRNTGVKGEKIAYKSSIAKERGRPHHSNTLSSKVSRLVPIE